MTELPTFLMMEALLGHRGGAKAWIFSPSVSVTGMESFTNAIRKKLTAGTGADETSSFDNAISEAKASNARSMEVNDSLITLE